LENTLKQKLQLITNSESGYRKLTQSGYFSIPLTKHIRNIQKYSKDDD